jgi:hypothetical protein
MGLLRNLGLLGAGLLFGCTPVASGGQGNSSTDLSRVPQSVVVNGRTYDVESEYIPRVVMCENGFAPSEALKAQAIASRTYLTYRTRGESTPTITDGQSDQVFTCSSNKNGTYVSPEVMAAVQATNGQVVTHADTVIAGFYVAGAGRDSSCDRTTDPTNTERFVTINVDKSGTAVTPTALGSSTDVANRGAMGQNLANCLAQRSGYAASQLLAYFYGEDIVVRGDNGSQTSVPPPSEDDPAAEPDPSSANTSSSSASDINPACVDPSTVSGYTPCWSFTLQCWTVIGTCVQSIADMQWYQCGPDGGFSGPVDTADGSGPQGDCTSMNALSGS